MIQQNPDAVLQWLRKMSNVSDNHLCGSNNHFKKIIVVILVAALLLPNKVLRASA